MNINSLQVAEQTTMAELSHIKAGLRPTDDPRVWEHSQYGKIVLSDEDMKEVEYNASLVQQGMPSNIMDNARNMAETQIMNKLHELECGTSDDSNHAGGADGFVFAVALLLLIVVLVVVISP